ncbi:DDE-type integrase/transposase/recombinase [Halocynthiibacter sp. C4]|uniref:DDE-type integrase/transposase/recombinase n=1 Tax=Halocynthiibacter sp. C4 TaxID=2992758 RepID=UPI00406C439B
MLAIVARTNGAPNVSIHDKLSNGRSSKILTVLDKHTCQALCVEVKERMGSDDVLEVLHRLLVKYGKSDSIRSEKGGEFITQNLQDWLRKIWVKPIQTYPGRTDITNGSTVLCAEKP